MKSNDIIDIIHAMNFRTLDLNLLRVFVALHQHRNVTRAALSLGLSQPAVSAALTRLRDHLRDALFVRMGNAMIPTERAERLAPTVIAALAQLETALGAAEGFDPARSEAVFTLRGADFFSTRLLPTLAASLAEEAPGVVLRFLDTARGDLVSALGSGDVDLALDQPSAVPAWISHQTLFASPFVVIAARSNPAVRAAGLAPGDTLPLALFCALPHALRSVDGSLSGMTDAALAQRGLGRRVALAVPHFDAVLSAVAAGPMIATVPIQLVARPDAVPDLVVLAPPIEIPVPKLQLYWHRRHDHTPAQIWLRERVLREVARLWGHDADFD